VIRTILALAAAGSILTATVAPAVAADRTPMLMEGKKTLYQRVLSRPGAVLKRQPGDGPGAQQPALTRFYVYSRQNVGGADWLEVGLTAKGKTDGWLREDLTLPWKQQLALAFTNPAGRDRALLFKERKDLAAIVEADKPDAQVQPLRKAVETGKGDPRVVSQEPATYVDIAKQFYLLPIMEAEETFSGMGHRVRMLRIASVSAQDDKQGANTAAPTRTVRRCSRISVRRWCSSSTPRCPWTPISTVRAARCAASPPRSTRPASATG
jgi:hypothetical protein